MRVAIVGGGISGLAAAHRLLELGRERERDVEIRLLEAGPRLGGVLSTEHVDGLVLERGPDSMITDKPWARGRSPGAAAWCAAAGCIRCRWGSSSSPRRGSGR